MPDAELMVEVMRGDFVESVHRGHGVICDETGEIVQSWGDPAKVILPRSSIKMIQALPLIESGAADLAGLTTAHLALACASHQGAAAHTEPVTAWLSQLGLDDSDLRCGKQIPADRTTRIEMFNRDQPPCQVHNSCSGKHAGFLTVAKHLAANGAYTEVDHPVQLAVRDAQEDVTGEISQGFALDGCAAPNFSMSLLGHARAMARFAVAKDDAAQLRERASARLVQAMANHPDLVAGKGRACTELMQAIGAPNVVKFGAEGVFSVILPQLRMGAALKIEDGSARAVECAIAAVLVRLGVADPSDPLIMRRLTPVQKNRAGQETGVIRPAAAFYQGGARAA